MQCYSSKIHKTKKLEICHKFRYLAQNGNLVCARPPEVVFIVFFKDKNMILIRNYEGSIVMVWLQSAIILNCISWQTKGRWKSTTESEQHHHNALKGSYNWVFLMHCMWYNHHCISHNSIHEIRPTTHPCFQVILYNTLPLSALCETRQHHLES